jgi:hypothetical protein
VKFARKNFFNSPQVVGISGTLTAIGDSPSLFKTNTHAISCIKEINSCIVASAEAIGDNQIGRMDYPYLIPLKKWTEWEIVTEEEAPFFGCYRSVLTLSRKQETALWVYVPVNQTQPNCAKSDGKYRKYTIEDPAYWKEMDRKR